MMNNIIWDAVVWLRKKLNGDKEDILEAVNNVQNLFKTSADATATPSDIMAGKTAYNGTILMTGTIPDKGAWTGETTGSGNVAIPAGRHNGNGYVSGAGAYNAGVSATKKGTAGTGDVLAGKTFTNASSVGAAGAMANKGAVTVDAGAVTQDDTYTYLAVPSAAFYNANSKLRTKNSNLTQIAHGITNIVNKKVTVNCGFYPRTIILITKVLTDSGILTNGGDGFLYSIESITPDKYWQNVNGGRNGATIVRKNTGFEVTFAENMANTELRYTVLNK